jgi:hypothetical protein
MGTSDPGGDPVRVRILDAEFVEFAGERMPIEEFLYEIRCLCRAIDGRAKPWLELEAAIAGVPPGVLDVIHADVRRSGIRHIELVTGPR